MPNPGQSALRTSPDSTAFPPVLPLFKLEPRDDRERYSVGVGAWLGMRGLGALLGWFVRTPAPPIEK